MGPLVSVAVPLGSVDLDLTKARFAGPIVVIELDMKFGSVDIRLPDGASASIDEEEATAARSSDEATRNTVCSRST